MNHDARIDQMLGLVLELAAGNLDARLEPLSRTEPLDGVIEGLNMLAEELSASTRALKRSEESFRSLIERLPDAIFVHRDGRFVYANSAALALLGYENASELLESSTRPNSVDSVLHLDENQEVSKRAYALCSSLPPPTAREGRLFHRDGSPVEVEFSSIKVNFDGQLAELAIARKISARKQLMAKMMEIDRMVAVGTLAAGVGHEINNPLAYVVHNLDFAIESLVGVSCCTQGGASLSSPTDISVREALIEAREGAERVRRIVRDLKTFSRSPDECTGSVDVEAALESAVSMASNEIRHRAHLVREYNATTAVAGNASRLGQVFLNLLLNAAHAIAEGAASANQITVRTRTVQEHVHVEIQDTGSGIEAEHMPRIFDPFFTTKPVGHGMGLGLYICKRIVKQHEGELQVESRPGQGSIFRVILPTARGVEKTSEKPVFASAPHQKRARILVVDDELNVGRSLARALSREHEVSVLTDARQALRSLTDGIRYDVVLCDLMMPDMTGVELYAEVESKQPEMARRMLFFTGGAFTAATREFALRMAARCLTKPLDLGELRRRVEQSALQLET